MQDINQLILYFSSEISIISPHLFLISDVECCSITERITLLCTLCDSMLKLVEVDITIVEKKLIQQDTHTRNWYDFVYYIFSAFIRR